MSFLINTPSKQKTFILDLDAMKRVKRKIGEKKRCGNKKGKNFIFSLLCLNGLKIFAKKIAENYFFLLD